jgi:GT2 family glycosyltransferase
MFSFFHGIQIIRRDGVLVFSRRLFEKLSWNTKVAFSRLRYLGRLSQGQIDVSEVPSPVPVVPHTVGFDIVICVHNALEDVKRCLDSVIQYSIPPFSIIVVDDGSDDPTRDYLIDFSNLHQVIRIRNEAARGYTSAANQGLRQSKADIVVLLNSDTVVPPEWLDRLASCALSDPGIGLVGPLSNTASWQSIPRIESNGDWASNPIPDGISIAEMGKLVFEYSHRLYPDIPFLNGFCLVIRREVIDEIGFFDEDTFGQGYGEENDYCLRARKAGWKLALADDTYIYHAQSRSYSNERRKRLSEQAGEKLSRKHGQRIIDQGVEFCLNDRVLTGIRSHSQAIFEREDLIKAGQNRFAGKKALFILPIQEPGEKCCISKSTPCGKWG